MKNYKIAAASHWQFCAAALALLSVLYAQGRAPTYLVAMVNVKIRMPTPSNFRPRSCRQSKRMVAKPAALP